MKTVQESFNYWRAQGVEAMEQRAKEIENMIENNADVDIRSLNVELQGIKEAKEDVTMEIEKRNLKTVETMNTEVRSFGEDVTSTAEYRSAFGKHMLGMQMTETEKRAFAAGLEKRADAFNASTDSLAVLPESLLNEVIKKAGEKGGLMAHVRKFNMPTKIAIPVANPTGDAHWHTEGAAIETEKAELINVKFDGFEVARILSVSAKVRKMSLPAFEAYLVEELANSVIETINEALVNGDGVNKPTGIMTSITQSVAGGITYENILEAIATIKRGYSQGAKFACNNRTLWSKLYGLVDGNERPLLIQNVQADGVSKLLGFEVIIDDHIEDDVLLFGNWSYCACNMPEPIAVEVSTQSGFRAGVIDFRALAIADAKVIVPEAFVKIVA